MIIVYTLVSLFKRILEQTNRKNVNPNVQQFLSLHKDIFSYVTSREVDIEMIRRLIVVDTNSWKGLDGMQRLSSRGDIEIFLFDHHDGNGSPLDGYPVKQIQVVPEKGYTPHSSREHLRTENG